MLRKDRVAVAWIDGGTVDGDFAVSMLNLFTSRNDRIATVIRIGGALLSRQRNEIVASFLDRDIEWLFFIDSDETITVEAFDKIVDAAHDKLRPIVAGVYFAAWANEAGPHPMPMPMILAKNKGGRYDPIWDMPDDAVIPIDAAGTGALLIHRSVLEAMRDASDSSVLGQHEVGKWCWFRDMPVVGEWVGEDIFFCKRAKDLGFNLVAATGARLGHHKGYWVTDAQFKHYLSEHPEIVSARHEVKYEGVSDE